MVSSGRPSLGFFIVGWRKGGLCHVSKLMSPGSLLQNRFRSP